MGGVCSTHGRDEVCIQKFWMQYLMGRDHSEDKGVNEKIILEFILGKMCGTRCIWLRTETSGGLL
jgi:hypothetical protein